MTGFKRHILVLEDDVTLASSIEAAFKRQGFEVYTTSSFQKARELLDSKPIGTLILDCLLPELSGIEFVESIRPRHPTLEVILMSGVLVDPAFIKDALKAVSSRYFFKKPFQMDQLISLVDRSEVVSSQIKLDPQTTLYQMFGQSKSVNGGKLKIVEALNKINGFDLPFVGHLLVESNFSGDLNLIMEDGRRFDLSFFQGNIVSVDIKDHETYIGKLLVQMGFLHPQDLSMARMEQGEKKLGEILVDRFMVSPHALDLALIHQMSLRLSKIIVDQKMTLKLSKAEIELKQPFIDREKFAEFLHDWIASKLSLQWLRTHYIRWHSYHLVQGSSFKENHKAFALPLVRALPDLIRALTSEVTLLETLDSKKYLEEPFYKALHYLLICGVLAFEASSKQSQDDRLKYLNKIYSQLYSLDKIKIFDVLSQMVNVGKENPEEVFRGFSEMIGSPPASKDKQLVDIYQKLMSLAKESFEFIKGGGLKKLKDQMVRKEIEMKTKATQQYEDAKNHLQRGSYKLAFDLLVSVQAVDPKADLLRVYMSWARLCLMSPNQDQRNSVISEVEMELLQVSPEEKLDVVFIFVQGLLFKAQGDLHQAYKLFSRGISIDPNLIAARREMALIVESTKQRKSEGLGKDLKDAFSSLFKKS